MEMTDARQRAVALIEEAGTLLGMIPRLLDDNDRLRAGAEAAAREAEGLRGEIDALRAEIQQLRGEREDLVEIMARVAADVGRLGEIVAKARPSERKSPFWREPSAGAPAAGGAPNPPASSGVAWR